MKTSFKPLAILGAGSWGTALALHLSRLGEPIHLWSKDASQVKSIQETGENKRYLPGEVFPQHLYVMHSLKDALEGVDDIILAVPSAGFREVLMQLKPHLPLQARLMIASKGLDEYSKQLLHTLIEEILGNHHPVAILSGPSFAKEVARQLPTAVVIASHHKTFAEELLKRFTSNRFRVYLSQDMIGVEISGVVKNALAIATGISDGMGLGANARAALITRGLVEMSRLGIALGGEADTFKGLAGLGDLILTCTDDQSRNRRFGLHLGKGLSPKEAEQVIGQTIEGKKNAELIVKLALKAKVEMPIVFAVTKVLQGMLSPLQVMEELLSRPSKTE